MMNNEKKYLNILGEKVYLEVGTYDNNSRLGIQLFTEDGDLWNDLTRNLSSEPILSPYQAYLCNDITQETRNSIFQSGLISYSLGKGLIGYELVEFDIDKLREYDPVGVKKYEEDMNLSKMFYL